MDLVRLGRHDGVAVLTLNDPGRRNAMSVGMGRALHDLLGPLATETDLRCAVLTGEPPAFSAGGDLDMLEEHARRTRDEGFDASGPMLDFYRLFLALRDLPVPVVAAVNGHAVGAGLCAAVACDLVLVAEDARLGVTFARLGIHPGMGASWLLPRLVGRQRAAELLYTGRLVSGTEAASYGIALAAYPDDQVLDRALELAGQIAASAPRVVRQLKTTLQRTWQHTLDEHLRAEAAAQATSYGTADALEGIAAVRAGRQPRFTGR